MTLSSAFTLPIPLKHSLTTPTLRILTSHHSHHLPPHPRRRRPRTPLISPQSSAAATNPINPAHDPPTIQQPPTPSTPSITPHALLQPPKTLHLPPSRAATTFRLLLTRLKEFSKSEPFIRTRLILAIFFMLTSKLVGITVPLLFKRTIDALSLSTLPKSTTPLTIFTSITSQTFKPVAILLILYCAARLIADISYELRNAVFAKAGQRLGRRLTRSAFSTLHTLGAEWYAGIASGAVARAVDRGTRAVLVIFRALVFGFIPSIFELVLVLGVMASRGWTGGVWVVGVMFVLFVTWTLLVNDKLGKTRSVMNALDIEASARLTDSLINYEAVSVFDNAEFERRRFDSCLKAFEDASIRNEWQYALLNTGQKSIFAVGLTLVFFMTSVDIVNGLKTVGDIAMIAIMLKQLWVPLNFMGWQYRELRQSLVDLQNLFDLVETDPTVVDVEGAKELEVSGGAIVFDNVCFSYPAQASKSASVFAKDNYSQNGHGDEDGEANGKVVSGERTIIKNLSFRVPPGKTFAIVGESGSGKSTALRLLYRLYNIDSGRVLIDGQDVSQVTLSSLRDSIAMVPQDTILFNDTIGYNIGYGRPGASMDEIVEAAKAASIHQVIMRMKNGYNTMCGERGVRLSGGERQRLSAARAFLKNSKIVMQDEATSALDSKTEAEVTKALKTLGKNRTSLVVAHRLSTVFDADWIIVMSKGVVVEEGTHRSLLKIPGGVYKAMWERQQDYNYQEDKATVLSHAHDHADGDHVVLDEVVDDIDSETVDGRGYKDELTRKYA